MKKYILIIALILCGCKQITKDQSSGENEIETDQTEFQKSHQYKSGDIVYLKPDSTEAVISDIETNWYRVDYRDKNGKLDKYNVYESEIFGQK